MVIEIRCITRVFGLIALATVFAIGATAQPAAAQQKGGGDDDASTGRGAAENWHPCQTGSEEYVNAMDVDGTVNVHYEGIIMMLCQGVMSTDAEGNFRSNQPVLRADAASATLRLVKSATGMSDSGCTGHEGSWPRPFHDVDKSTPHNFEIIEAWCLGIWNGVTADQFQPRSTLTRAQAASIVIRTLDFIWLAYYDVRFSDSVAECTDPEFSDVELDSTHGMAINQIACAGIVRGDTFREYLPGRQLTRGQLATILNVGVFQSFPQKGGGS